MRDKPNKKEMAIERAVQILCVVITIAGCILLGSCSTEDVCGYVTGYDIQCTNATDPYIGIGRSDCVYYLYIDGQKEAVHERTYLEARFDEYICIGY